MDSQRAYNYAMSAAVEGAALEPKAPFILDPQQIEGYDDWWKQANTRNFPFLPIKSVVVAGQVIPPPQRAQVDGTRMQISLGLAQSLEGALQSGTMMFDPSLGRSNGNEKSGKAIMALQQQGDQSTSDFLASFADVSMAYEARIVLDLIPKIYDRPGRIARIIDGEDKTEPKMLNQPAMDGPNGVPVPAPQPIPGMAPPGDVYHYDLTKGRYGVTVSIGKSKQSKMDAGADALGQLLSSEPQLFPLLGDMWLDFQDFPKSKEAMERVAKWRDAQFPFLKDDGQPGPQDVQAMQQQLQQQGAQLQQLQAMVQNDQMKVQAQIQTAQIKADSAIQTTQIKADSDQKIAALNAQIDALKGFLQQKHDRQMASHDAAHEMALASADVGHTAAKEAAKASAQAALAPLKMDPLRDSVGQPLAPSSGEV